MATKSVATRSNSSVDDDLSDDYEALGSVTSTGTPTTTGVAASMMNYGEMELFMEAMDEDQDAIPLAPHVEVAFRKSMSDNNLLEMTRGESFYEDANLTEAEAVKIMPEGDTGLKWHALVIPDLFFRDGKLLRGLNKKDFNFENQEIKPRRPSLPITADSLFKSITEVTGSDGQTRYIFSGVLNGWPALNFFELVTLLEKKSSLLPSPKDLWTGKIAWSQVWKAGEEGAQGIPPKIRDEKRIYRATLRAAPWTSKGWSEESPGFAWWYEPFHDLSDEPKMTYGTNMLTQLADPLAVCTHIHMVSHRYAVQRESAKDRLTYHSVCLLEWDHGNYCTVVEMAYLNGMGGYKGKSNWIPDRDEPITALYKSMPPEMVLPWRMTSAEIRCIDVPSKSFKDFQQFVLSHKGNMGRFVDPHFSWSHAGRLSFRSKHHLAQYLLNYIRRDSSYGELKRNCQTFAADFCAFVAGKKQVLPFHPVSRIDFQNRPHLFLYDSTLYMSKDEKKGIQKKTSLSTKAQIGV